MTKVELVENIRKKKSFLCIGLDTDLTKIPSFLLKEKDPIFSFNKAIIDSTHDLCVAYKPNIAFYESLGAKGWDSLQKTLEYIPDDIFTIADAKRGDIGNSSSYYAKTFFETFSFDSVTLSPYMGKDSIEPFLQYENKWVILLALTSNPGSVDFQMLPSNNSLVYKEVLLKSKNWGTDKNTMYVVGATNSNSFKEVRSIVPNHFLLVPGIGAQGGDLHKLVQNGINEDCGLLVNSSRSIIYASDDKQFDQNSRKAAKEVQKQMSVYI